VLPLAVIGPEIIFPLAPEAFRPTGREEDEGEYRTEIDEAAETIEPTESLDEETAGALCITWDAELVGTETDADPAVRYLCTIYPSGPVLKLTCHQV